MKTVSNPGKKILIIAILCISTLVAKAQEDTDTVAVKKSIECAEGFYSILQQGAKGITFGLEFENELKKYVGGRTDMNDIDMPSDIPYIYYGKHKYRHPSLMAYKDVLEKMAEEASDFDISFNVLTAKDHGISNIVSVLVSKVVVYKGNRFDYIDWVEVKHRDGDVENRYTIERIMATSTIRIVGNDGEPLTSADVNSKTSDGLITKLPNSCGVTVVGIEDTSRTLTISDPYYSDTVRITIMRGEDQKVQLKGKKTSDEVKIRDRIVYKEISVTKEQTKIDLSKDARLILGVSNGISSSEIIGFYGEVGLGEHNGVCMIGGYSPGFNDKYGERWSIGLKTYLKSVFFSAHYGTLLNVYGTNEGSFNVLDDGSFNFPGSSKYGKYCISILAGYDHRFNWLHFTTGVGISIPQQNLSHILFTWNIGLGFSLIDFVNH